MLLNSSNVAVYSFNVCFSECNTVLLVAIELSCLPSEVLLLGHYSPLPILNTWGMQNWCTSIDIPRTSQTNIWYQTPPHRPLATTSQENNGQLSTYSGVDMTPAWSAFMNGAALQAHCALAERSKQHRNISLKAAHSTDWNEGWLPSIQRTLRQLFGLMTLHLLNK